MFWGLVFCFTTSNGQDAESRRFEALTVNDGLSQGFVTSVLQDRTGFMWFGTHDGLNQYDGYQFTVHRHDPDNPYSLADNVVTCVFEDSRNLLWIGTASHGLELFDRRTGRFLHFPSGTENGPSANFIEAISEDASGMLWLVTPTGTDRVEVVENLADATPSPHFTWLESPLRPNNEAGSGLFHTSGGLTYLHSEFAVYRLEKKHKSYPFEKIWETEDRKNGQVVRILEDTVSGLFILVFPRSIIRFADKNLQDPETFYSSDQIITVSTIDHDGYLWIEDNAHFVRIHLATGHQTRYCTDASLLKAAQNTLRHYTDPRGVVWITTSGFGLLKYHPARDYFHHIAPGQNTYQILALPNGGLVLNSKKYLDLKSGSSTLLEKPVPDLWEADYRRSAAEFDNGTMWMNSESGVVETTLDGRIMRRLDLGGGRPFPLYKAQNGYLWAGSDSLLFRIDTRTTAVARYPIPVSPGSNGYDLVQGIAEDTDGSLWLATTAGLLHFDYKQPTPWTIYRHHPDQKGSLSHDLVLSVCADGAEPTRYLWVGTKGGGLNRLDRQNGTFEVFNEKDGLPNPVVYGILTDRHHNVWVSTNRGIAVRYFKEQNFRKFSVNDGLQDLEYNRYAFARRNDTLFFGGLNGVNYFVPEQINTLPPPSVFLTGIKIFNRPVVPEVWGQAMQGTGITLRYDQNMVGLVFAAADYLGAGQLRYRYRLEGVDKQWVETETAHEANYTNLDPGSYRFIAMASLDGVAWSEQRVLVKLRILAPFWQTWWFISLCLMATAGALYSVYRYRLSQLIRLQNLRNRISRDLHDEIGSSLSAISIYSKVASEQLKNGSDNPAKLVTKIGENTTRAMEAMSDIIWTTQTENDTLERVVYRMREHAVQLFESGRYSLHFEEKIHNRNLGLDMEKRKDLILIYKEALNNIVKHAEGKNVWITIEESSHKIDLLIRDDGKGMEPNESRKGNGLNNMTARAASLRGKLHLESEPAKGTALRLEIAAS